VVIPPVFREKMLNELHWEHPGVCGMKAIARTCVWWPKMDEGIERAVKGCTVCQSVRNPPPHAPLIPWKWPTRPFQRVHIDFCQEGKDYFLVIIDSHSKWIEIKHMTSTTTQRTLDEVRLIFAVYGLPEEVVSDNGPQFTANEFVEFMTKNGIKHTLVPPYHPQSNGAAERSMSVVKEALAKQVIQGTQGVSMKHRLANFLLRYRTTPHSTTGVSPGELMMKRRLRTRLSLVKPDLAQVVEGKQEQQKVYKDGKGKSERKRKGCVR
jgi:transposase InsO family protein